MRGEGGKGYRKISHTHARLRPSYPLASARSINGEDLWKCVDIGCAVQGSGEDEQDSYDYPAGLPWYHVPVKHQGKVRDRLFEKAIPAVIETLAAGKWVLVHCQQSIHRGPILAAACMKRVCNVDAYVRFFLVPSKLCLDLCA